MSQVLPFTFTLTSSSGAQTPHLAAYSWFHIISGFKIFFQKCFLQCEPVSSRRFFLVSSPLFHFFKFSWNLGYSFHFPKVTSWVLDKSLKVSSPSTFLKIFEPWIKPVSILVYTFPGVIKRNNLIAQVSYL